MSNPNISAHRPVKSALNRGRIQKAARRVLMLNGEVTTRDALAWAYSRKLAWGERIWKSDYRQVREALRLVAVPIGRAGGRGRPIIWRLKGG
jgi:hypothetical protein